MQHRENRRWIVLSMVPVVAMLLVVALCWRNRTGSPPGPLDPASRDEVGALPATDVRAERVERTRIDESRQADLTVLLDNGAPGQPASGARCWFRSNGDHGDGSELLADDRGELWLPDEARPAQFVVWHRHGARRLDAQDQVAAPRTLTLDSAGAIVVQVPGVGERPFRVRIEPPGDDTGSTAPLPIRCMGTDERAICEGVPTAWGPVVVQVEFDGGRLRSAPVQAIAGQDIVVSVAPPSPCQVRGIVVDEAGTPLSDVFLTLYPEDGVRLQTRGREQTTGADGAFLLGGVEPCRMQATFSKPDHGRLRLSVDCTAPADVDLGDVVLPRGRFIRGFVHANGQQVDREHFADLGVGHVAAEATAAMLSLPYGGVSGYGTVTLQDDGSFELLGVMPGRHLVFASQRADRRSWNAVFVEVGASDVDGVIVDVSLSRSWSCEVRRGDDGTPPADELLVAGEQATWFTKVAIDAGGHAEARIGAGPFLIGVRLGNDIRWLQHDSGLLDSAEVQIPSGSLVLDGVPLAHAGDLLMAGGRITYLGGQLPAQFLPLTMAGDRPLSADAQSHRVDHLPAGDYRYELITPEWGRRSVTFRLQAGELLHVPWPHGR